MKIKSTDQQLLEEAYTKLHNTSVKEAHAQQLPRLGQVVTKAYSEGDDMREYVVVGIQRGEGHNEVWTYLYPTGPVDYENTKAERVSFPDGLNVN
tara:strand:+ start:1613 stop:1897 length:285 start_codon:yes stop_codon:yes gene_type:complete